MAKIYGLFGTLTGKLADTVMSVRNGEQIVRKYQPVVYNPSTEAQVAARAKLKALSQMSAVLASVIAIPRDGAVSSRNLFLKVNYPIANYINNEAQIPMGSIQLTRSSIAIPSLSVVRDSTDVTCRLNYTDNDIDRVMYVCVAVDNDNRLRVYDSGDAPAGVDGYFTKVFTLSNDFTFYVYAYGIRFNTDAARATYSNLSMITAETFAKVIVSRVLTDADITLTETICKSISPTT